MHGHLNVKYFATNCWHAGTKLEAVSAVKTFKHHMAGILAEKKIRTVAFEL